MKVAMKNPNSGQMKEIKVGWSWTIFFFTYVLGIPLFLRGLIGWGIASLVLPFIFLSACASASADQVASFFFVANIVLFALVVYLAATGNAKSAKKRLSKGWVFLDPESDAVKYAKGKWGIL